MTLTLQPVRVATGAEEEGMLVFDHDQRLLAVLIQLSPENEVAPGHWFLEVGFDRLGELSHPTFADLSEAEDWISQRSSVGRSRR
ncbi:hypothetical protein DC522_12580 [Microvirga sp. KLBC 81]|uniref:hypothetical protein n=1 Tax=Microvirga sp. KLBC 81 TaxID=1862707 RepID=UPI000D519914|nr:hypothetical protein [Microvirga sp. KLBC 81]PVE24119.1 hypothetical protein DC522_12580 [Microvirga sp. KLBC 81]